jgi:hypothetical protein
MCLPRRLSRSLPLLATGLLTTVLAVAGPGAPPAGAAGPIPRRIVSAIGSTPVVQPDMPDRGRSDPQSVSGDGRFIAFVTTAGDPNGFQDVYVRDRWTGTSELVSQSSTGGLGNAASYGPSISTDGRYVAFVSPATTLVPGDDFERDVFVRDRVRRTTTRVNRRPDGTSASEPYYAQISANGQAIVWQTFSGATFVKGLPTGSITNPVSGGFVQVSLSGDGHHLAYVDLAGDGVVRRIRIGDGAVGTVSVSPSGVPRRGAFPSISYDGNQVAFTSTASDIDPTAPGGGVFVRDMLDGATDWWARASAESLVLSGNARVLTFTTRARLTADDTDGDPDVYAAQGRHYMLLSGELPPSPRSGREPWYAELSGDGRVATLVSGAVVPGSGSGGGLRRWAVSTLLSESEGSRGLIRLGYRRLFDRDPTTAELDARVAQVDSLARTTAEVVLDDLRRESFSGPRAGVVRLYLAYFLRDPDTSGYQYWVGQRRSGRSLDSISQAFSGTPEFRTLYGSLSNRAFVDRVYRNVLGRAPDAAGSDFWTSQLDRGARNRGQVMTGFSESPENKAATRNKVEAITYIESIFGSVPDAHRMAQLEGGWIVGLPITDTIDQYWG